MPTFFIFRRIENWLSSFRYDSAILVRTVRAAGLVVGLFIIGTFGYWYLTDGRYDLLTCAYMTIVTVTTVGFEEVIEVGDDTALKTFTMGLILVGTGVALYFASSFTAFIVNGDLRNLIQMRRMERDIQNLSNHYIVAGIGNTGEYVLDELLRSRRDVLVIDSDRDRVDEVRDAHEYDFPFIIGDATQDGCLERAGIERAAGLICSLGNDRDNLFVTVTARSINPEMKIVTRGSHPESEEKFKMAGATSVIYTNVLGGLRMAAEAIRPSVTTFLDLMMQDHGHYRRVEELEIPEHSPLVGRMLRNTGIRKHTDALIIAVQEPDTDEYVFNPGPDYQLKSGSDLIVLTLLEDVETLDAIIDGSFRG